MLVKVLGVFGDSGCLLAGFHGAPPRSHVGVRRHAPVAYVFHNSPHSVGEPRLERGPRLPPKREAPNLGLLLGVSCHFTSLSSQGTLVSPPSLEPDSRWRPCTARSPSRLWPGSSRLQSTWRLPLPPSKSRTACLEMSPCHLRVSWLSIHGPCSTSRVRPAASAPRHQ